VRVGLGYDIHRLVPGRPLVLGGLLLNSELGLEGHSDADVLVHAIMDALLGAAALRDIGHYFPPTDERFRGASSLDLLRQVAGLLEKQGHRVVNIDAVVVAEQPRIGPHIGDMTVCIARALGVSPESIGIKATTNEGVGAEGRLEAISAQAVALIEQLSERD
jgi:2-C-methyl-D-erythritol 2,4-cyclodiphosphate synthase